MERLEAFSRCFQHGKAYILSATEVPCDVITQAACSLLERHSCSLSMIPFSIQPDQVLAHVVQLAESLHQPMDPDTGHDEHVAFLEAQGSLDSHSQLLLDTASDCGLQALNQDGQDQNLSNLARALLMAQKSA
ncbi:hypothetical protein WJX84_003090 [Apatococcus fuscideae]|uniref:Uncharacterized protein n=1 Tax=Apatococcus fuscideae TaxID=2026836 RepID=A0AAW1T2N3_9CHLO